MRNAHQGPLTLIKASQRAPMLIAPMATVPNTPLHAPRQPSRSVLAYSGLLALLAVVCLLTGFMPGEAVHGALGGVLLTAALLGVLIEAIIPSRVTLPLRLTWGGLATVTGVVLILSPMLHRLASGLMLAGFLLLQAGLVIFFAVRASRRAEIGAPSLAIDGVVSVGLAIFVIATYPFPQQWILGSIVAVALLDYAAALAFREFDGR